MLANYAKWYSFTPPQRPNFPPPLTLWPGSGSRAPVGARWRRDAGPRGGPGPSFGGLSSRSTVSTVPLGSTAARVARLGELTGLLGRRWGRAPMGVVAQGAVGVLGALGTGLWFPQARRGAGSTAARAGGFLGQAQSVHAGLSGGLGDPLQPGFFRSSK